MFNINNEDTRTTSFFALEKTKKPLVLKGFLLSEVLKDIALVFLLVTWNISHTFFKSSYC